MAEEVKVQGYMAQLLDELGWNKGTRIPLADPENQGMETVLINRQNEIQQLKEALILQNQKRDDLNKYKDYVHTEYQENTRLLFAHKQQLEQEVKIKQLSCNEADRLDRDVQECTKQSKDITSRFDRLQSNIARLLKKADTLKSEVCGERGALQEWRAALEQKSVDIAAIDRFTKQDLSVAKALETKRQKLKVEHDRMHERLHQLVSNLSAEERACERISVQVMEGMEQRKQMMAMWTGAVENLRQRDVDIRHIREDYAVLEAEASSLAEKSREQQTFCEQQRGNNAEALKENAKVNQQLSQMRLAHMQLAEQNVTDDSEAQSLMRELSNVRIQLEKMHMENRRIMEEQYRKDRAISAITEKIKELKEKITESLDKTKSSEKRAKQLEDMLNEEEQYTSKVTLNQQRAMHCSFVEQQKLLALKNEEKLFQMQLKAAKAIMSKLDSKQRGVERTLQSQKESIYAVCYQLETIGARVAHMEGAQAERECSEELVERERRLKDVRARHTARGALLARHGARLNEDMRRLGREITDLARVHDNLQSRLKSSLLNVAGGEKQLGEARGEWRRQRVSEALTRLRVAHAGRAVRGLQDKAFSLDMQRLQLEAAMNERMVEIAARKDMFAVQKRALFEDCGKLKGEIRERESRIEQLKKRYDIFIASLGKDESGQQLSVTFFKIKFAAERAELRERGAALDTDITRCEKDMNALEATLRVMHAAHSHLLRHVTPLNSDAPEMEEVHNLAQKYYSMRDELKQMNATIAKLEAITKELSDRLSELSAKHKALSNREAEADNELEAARDRVSRTQNRLENARDVVRANARRAKKLVEGPSDWRYFQVAVWVRDHSEAAGDALRSLVELINESPEAAARFASLVASADLLQHITKHQRRLAAFVQRILDDAGSNVRDYVEDSICVFSSSSSSRTTSSVASGYTRLLTPFRRQLATKLQEPALLENIAESSTRRSTVQLRVVTLGLDCPSEQLTTSESNRRSSRR